MYELRLKKRCLIYLYDISFEPQLEKDSRLLKEILLRRVNKDLVKIFGEGYICSGDVLFVLKSE
jgi:hypothetical protein